MTDKELIERYRKAVIWLKANWGVSGTDLAENGEKYNHKRWSKGLKRLEELEDELKIRGITYGKE